MQSCNVRPDSSARPEYIAAFSEVVRRISSALSDMPARVLPVRMYVAGGAALHFHIGERVSRDIDAAFSHRIVLPDNLEVAYHDADGAARLLYFDRQYNETLGLLHEDAHDDSIPLTLTGVDARVLEIRVLSPLDLAVTKLGRFSSQDRDDIAALARRRLIAADRLRRRAEEALRGYVGDIGRVNGSIEAAVRIVADVAIRTAKGRR